MGVKIHLKIEIINFDKILLNNLNFFAISRDIVCYGTYYFLDIFLKDANIFVKDAGRRKSCKDIGKRNYRMNYFKKAQTRIYFTQR